MKPKTRERLKAYKEACLYWLAERAAWAAYEKVLASANDGEGFDYCAMMEAETFEGLQKWKAKLETEKYPHETRMWDGELLVNFLLRLIEEEIECRRERIKNRLVIKELEELLTILYGERLARLQSLIAAAEERLAELRGQIDKERKK